MGIPTSLPLTWTFGWGDRFVATTSTQSYVPLRGALVILRGSHFGPLTWAFGGGDIARLRAFMPQIERSHWQPSLRWRRHGGRHLKLVRDDNGLTDNHATSPISVALI